MNVTNTQERAAQIPLENLAGNATLSDSEKVGEVARQFEAVLLRQMLQEARKTDNPDHSAVAGIYDDMINNQLADTISRSGEVGLAKSLQTQLTRQVLPHGEETAAPKISPSTPNLHRT